MRVRRSRHRPDYPRLATRYMTGTESVRQIAESEGVNVSSLQVHASKHKWTSMREQWQREQAEEDLKAEQDARKKRRDQAVQMAYSAKVLIFKRLMQRMKNPLYLPTVQEYALIQRLERDLDEPGWAKAESEKTATTVNVAIGIQDVLDRVKAARKAEVVDVDHAPGPPQEIAGFMLDGEDDEDH